MKVMKKSFYSICSFLSIFASAALFFGCAEEFDTTFQVEKPATVAEEEALNQYNTLVSYVDASSFRLGNTLTSSSFDAGSVDASLTLSNFNEVTISDLFVHSQQVSDEGNVNMLTASALASDISEKGINLFVNAVCASNNINTNYLESLIEPQIVEDDPLSGEDVMDFESVAVGTTYPMKKSTGDAGKGTATVESFDGSNAIHVKGTNQSFPAITFTFPDGRKLGDYTDLEIDYYAVNNTALTQKLFVSVAGKNAEFKTPKDYGCTLKSWGRGKISIPMEALSFSDDQKQQTQVEIIIGPKLMNCEYYIDNVTMKYSYVPTHEVQKTDQEKFDIISGELNKFITAAIEAAPNAGSWMVADCPVTANPIWKVTMGDNYFGYAAKMIRAQNASAKLFVSENLTDASVRSAFVAALKEADKISKVDGIDVPVTVNASSFSASEFTAMLKELDATGKLIRLTIQSVSGADADAANVLAQVVTIYKQTVKAGQQYGINFGSVIESATNAGLWSTGYNRKVTYASFADAL